MFKRTKRNNKLNKKCSLALVWSRSHTYILIDHFRLVCSVSFAAAKKHGSWKRLRGAISYQLRNQKANLFPRRYYRVQLHLAAQSGSFVSLPTWASESERSQWGRAPPPATLATPPHRWVRGPRTQKGPLAFSPVNRLACPRKAPRYYQASKKYNILKSEPNAHNFCGF